jgi:hypothetical protein
MKDETPVPRNGRPPLIDPSGPTTALIDRAIDSFRQVMETRLAGIDRATELVASDLIQARAETDLAQQRLLATVTKDLGALQALLGARIDGMDTATKRLAESAAKFPSDLDKAIASLREILAGDIAQALAETRRVEDVTQEKFDRVDAQFVSNDKALTAALAAQEKAAAEQQKSNTLAIDKSENTTQETIRANDAKTASSIDAQAQTMGDIKERVVRIESAGVGAAVQRSEAREDRSEVRDNVGQKLLMLGVGLSALVIIVNVLLYIAVHGFKP